MRRELAELVTLPGWTVRVMRGRLIVQGYRVSCVIDHDANVIELSSLAPRWARRDLVRRAIGIIESDADRPGPFAILYRDDGKSRDVTNAPKGGNRRHR
jgi:hypothetical protein